jgi:hypothetical protein
MGNRKNATKLEHRNRMPNLKKKGDEVECEN